MCFTLFSSSKFALFDQVRHLRRWAAFWLLVERLEEMGARFKLSWARPTDPGNPDRRQLISELRPWQVNGEKLSSKDKPCLWPPFSDERWDPQFEFEWTRVRCGFSLGLWRGWWSGQGSGAVFPQGLQGLSKAVVSLQAKGKAKLEVTALAKDRRFWGQDQKLQNKWAFLSEIDISKIFNICTKKTGSWTLRVQQILFFPNDWLCVILIRQCLMCIPLPYFIIWRWWNLFALCCREKRQDHTKRRSGCLKVENIRT